AIFRKNKKEIIGKIIMKKLVAHAALCTLLPVLMLNSALIAQESTIQEEAQNEHVSIGIRKLTPAQRQGVSEKRALELFQTTEESIQERSGTPVAALHERATDEQADVVAKAGAKAYYYTSHPGALHFAVAVSPFGDVVRLANGSEYIVA